MSGAEEPGVSGETERPVTTRLLALIAAVANTTLDPRKLMQSACEEYNRRMAEINQREDRSGD